MCDLEVDIIKQKFKKCGHFSEKIIPNADLWKLDNECPFCFKSRKVKSYNSRFDNITCLKGTEKQIVCGGEIRARVYRRLENKIYFLGMLLGYGVIKADKMLDLLLIKNKLEKIKKEENASWWITNKKYLNLFDEADSFVDDYNNFDLVDTENLNEQIIIHKLNDKGDNGYFYHPTNELRVYFLRNCYFICDEIDDTELDSSELRDIRRFKNFCGIILKNGLLLDNPIKDKLNTIKPIKEWIK